MISSWEHCPPLSTTLVAYRACEYLVLNITNNYLHTIVSFHWRPVLIDVRWSVIFLWANRSFCDRCGFNRNYYNSAVGLLSPDSLRRKSRMWYRKVFVPKRDGSSVSCYTEFIKCLILIFLFPDGELYSGTVADFSGMEPIIYREPLQTEPYDSMTLNGKTEIF